MCVLNQGSIALFNSYGGLIPTAAALLPLEKLGAIDPPPHQFLWVGQERQQRSHHPYLISEP